VGAFALAYAVHKAASPIRFPPTVALTPVRALRWRRRARCCAARALRRPRAQLVARWMGKDVE
jgi:hypothetical protein